MLEGERTAINVAADATLAIPVSCVEDAGPLTGRIRYALAVTLEAAPGVTVGSTKRFALAFVSDSPFGRDTAGCAVEVL